MTSTAFREALSVTTVSMSDSGLKGLCELRITCFGANAWEGSESQQRLLLATQQNCTDTTNNNNNNEDETVKQMVQLQQQILALHQVWFV